MIAALLIVVGDGLTFVALCVAAVMDTLNTDRGEGVLEWLTGLAGALYDEVDAL